jgi:hypothetical protein
MHSLYPGILNAHGYSEHLDEQNNINCNIQLNFHLASSQEPIDVLNAINVILKCRCFLIHFKICISHVDQTNFQKYGWHIFLSKKLCVGIYVIIIQFNSILYYLCAESTATRPITDAAQ